MVNVFEKKIHSSPKPIHVERNLELEGREKVRWEQTNIREDGHEFPSSKMLWHVEIVVGTYFS